MSKCPVTFRGLTCRLEEGHTENHSPNPVGHHCHARNYFVATPPEMLMCRRHWYMVPAALRRAVWYAYRTGQCDDMDVSSEWLKAADAAIAAVAAREGSSA